jgi:hypothetical protein
VAALRQHGATDAYLAIDAFKVLLCATEKYDSQFRSAAAAAGAIPAITAAMRAHGSDAALQRCGTDVLRCFAWVGTEFADLLFAARAPAAVAAMMERHCADASMQRTACLALAQMCVPPGAQAVGRRAACAAVAAGAPAALLAALSAHATDEELLELAPRALAGLLAADVWPADGSAVWRATRDALVALIAARGCPQLAGEPDTMVLSAAAVALVQVPNNIDPGAAGETPGAAEMLCVALGVAAKLHDSAERADSEALCVTLANVCTRLVHTSGAALSAFSAAACSAGVVQLLTTIAAGAARPGDGPAVDRRTACISALLAIAMLVLRVPAGECLAAACGAHTLVDACRRSNAMASMPADQRDTVKVMARRLHALVAAHEAVDCDEACCAVPNCDLRLMSLRRCCLHGCAAVTATDGKPLLLCVGCRFAKFCCAAHQRQAWPRHKAVCLARSAVEAARARLLAHAGAAAGAARGDDAGA